MMMNESDDTVTRYPVPQGALPNSIEMTKA